MCVCMLLYVYDVCESVKNNQISRDFLYNFHYFPLFQVGIVFLSILCHIWKIVPDLYEAITKIQGNEPPVAASTSRNASSVQFNETMLNCSSRQKMIDEEVFFRSKSLLIFFTHYYIIQCTAFELVWP